MNRMKVLLWVVLGLALACFPVMGQQKLVVVAEAWPPFEFIGADGKPAGIDVDIVSAILTRMGIPFEVQILPWARAWKMIQDGQADAALTCSRKPEREPFVYYPTEDMWTSEYVFMVRKDRKKPVFSGYRDAAGLSVGVIRGNSYDPSFTAANLKTDEAPDLETNLKKLAGGRIDLFPVDRIVGLYTARQLGIGDSLSYYDFRLFSKGYPMVFARNSRYPNIRAVADRFERELKALKQSGEYAQIQARWLGQ